MIHLPLYIEKKLKELFPRQQDRNDFVSSLVKDALDNMEHAYDARQQTRDEVVMGGTLHLFSDGGSRGNPGQAAIGCLVKDTATGTVLGEVKEAIGIATNNVAEYKALIRGLELAEQFHPKSLVCHLDSELVVKQVTGQYKVKMATLQPLVEEILERSKSFTDISFIHIPRRENHLADALVNQALDSIAV